MKSVFSLTDHTKTSLMLDLDIMDDLGVYLPLIQFQVTKVRLHFTFWVGLRYQTCGNILWLLNP